MAKHPNKQNAHCVNCNTYKQHQVSLLKSRKASPNAQGQRKYEILKKGYGGSKRQVLKRKAKKTKKVTVRLTCSSCRRVQTRVLGRAKKFEIVAVKDNK